MSKPRILQTQLADQDLVDLWLYIAQDSPSRADRLLEKIARKIDLLGRSPRMGRPREELAAGLRSFPVGQYVIFYRLREPGIEVIRVLSGFRDLDRLLGHSD